MWCCYVLINISKISSRKTETIISEYSEVLAKRFSIDKDEVENLFGLEAKKEDENKIEPIKKIPTNTKKRILDPKRLQKVAISLGKLPSPDELLKVIELLPLNSTLSLLDKISVDGFNDALKERPEKLIQSVTV
jgi:hypothetical protein